MTALRIQNLEIRDCEDALQNSYCSWGRELDRDGPVGPDWADSDADQDHLRSLMLRGYDLYDGYSIPQDNTITALDAYVSIGINSQVISYDVVRILVRADAASPLLARIPGDARLEDGTDDQIAAAADLIELLCAAFKINRGKATKILYKKRPGFIPVIDSVVTDFLWKNFPFLLVGNSPMRDVLQLYKSILILKSEQLREVQSSLAAVGLVLSTARILSHLIWIGWRERVDEFGFGKPFTKIWETASLADAKAKAEECWREQCAAAPEGSPGNVS